MNRDCVHYVQGPSPLKLKKSIDFYVKNLFQLLITDYAEKTGYLKSHCDKDDFNICVHEANCSRKRN